MTNSFRKTFLKYGLAGVAGIVLIIALLFSLPVWTIPVVATENYTETAVKQESSTTYEQYEISKTPNKVTLFSNENIILYPGDIPPGIAFAFYPTQSQVDPVIKWAVNQGYIKTQIDDNSILLSSISNSVYYKWDFQADLLNASISGNINKTVLYRVFGKDAQDCSIVIDWNSPDTSENDVLVTLVKKSAAMDITAKAPTKDITTIDWISNSLNYKMARSGSLEFNLSDLLKQGSNSFIIVSAPSKNKSENSSPVQFSMKTSMKWNDVKVGSRPITKSTEVPVQVEKQRTVIKEEKGALWQLLFRK